jgi:hypothetical protein
VELAQGLLLLGAGLALRALVRRAGGSALAGDVALALLLLDPQIAAFAHYLWPEVLHLALGLGATLLLTGATAWPGLALAGAGFGLALLAKSLLGPFLPALLAVAFVRARWKGALALLAGVTAVTAPVVASNGLRHGHWGIANSGPFNLWVGLTDLPGRGEIDSVVVPHGQAWLGWSHDPDERNALLLSAVREKLRTEGPLSLLAGQVPKQYVRLFDRESFFTDQLPGGRWHPAQAPTPLSRTLRIWALGAYAIGLTLAGLGLGVAPWRERARALALPATFLAYNLGLFLFLHVKTRYRVALWPCLLLFAALGVDRLLRGEARGRGLVIGTLLAGLLLALAFGP